ncbi:hypothetical protein IAT38_005046 [Cryptococcus sp. DSM 104549]
MQPPRVNRYVDDILIKVPAFYGDTGGPGWYPELQHPVQTRLAVRFNPILGRTVYINPTAIFMTGVRHGMGMEDVRRVFTDLGVGHGMEFTLFTCHKFMTDVSIVIAEFPSARQAEQALLLANENRHLLDTPHFEFRARYSDVNATGPLQGTVRDILLVREELALTRLYLPTTLSSPHSPPPPTPQWNAVGFSRDAFRGKRKSSEYDAPTSSFDVYRDPAGSWGGADGPGDREPHGYDSFRAPTAKRRQLEPLSVNQWYTRPSGGDAQGGNYVQGKGFGPLGMSEVNGVKVGARNRYTESGGVQVPAKGKKGKVWNNTTAHKREASSETVGHLRVLGMASTPASTTHDMTLPITPPSPIGDYPTGGPLVIAHGDTTDSPESQAQGPPATPSQRAREKLDQLIQTLRDPSEPTPVEPAPPPAPTHADSHVHPAPHTHTLHTLPRKPTLDELRSPTIRPLYSSLEPYRHHFLPSTSHPHLEPRYIALSDERRVLTIAASRADLKGNHGEVWAVGDLSGEQRELLGLKRKWVFTGPEAERKWRKVGGRGLLELEMGQE